MNIPALSSKPKLRGYLHQEAFYVAWGACALLIAKSSSPTMFLASGVYSFGLLAMLGISALYHRPNWQPKWRSIMKRLDHSAIFIQIAGSMTPVALLALPIEQGMRLLTIAWIAAAAGIMQSVFWVSAPKYVKVTFYVVMGWLAVPYLSELKATLGLANASLLLLGGIAYTVGAIFYATKKPKLKPAIFGYHEFFHAFTLVGATLHFIVIYQLIQ